MCRLQRPGREGEAGESIGAFAFGRAVEEAGLAGVAAAGLQLRGGHDLVNGLHHRAAGCDGIESSGFGEGLHRAAVEAPGVGAAAEVVDGLVWPVLLAFFDQGTDRALAHGLNGGQPDAEARGCADAVVYGEELLGAVDVRQMHGYAEAEALVDGRYYPVRVVEPGVEDGAHIFQGIMGLEVGRPIGDQGVTDAVGLVEGVPGEGFYEVEDLYGNLLAEALGLCADDEILPFLGHQSGNLLAHSLAHDVGCAQGISGELLEDQQHLVLVDDDAVGLVEKLLEAGMRVGDGALPCLASMKASMFSIGPGRYRAIMAEMSLRLEGFNSLM